MTTGMLFVMNFWKGRRKDKDSPTPPVGSGDEQPTKQYLEESCLRQRVIDADLVKLVQLPPSLDTNEWLATHTISFFNHINLMYGVVSEYCTSDSCASMVGPDNAQYHWQDEKGKKVKQSAPQYIDHMMSYVQKSVTDETLFPTKFGQEFPAGFPDTVRKIHRYLFHVVAHLYHSHTGLLVTLGLQGHLNTLFVHFMLFSSLFQLLPGKEAEVLMDLHNGLLKAMQEDPNQNTHEGGSDSGAAADDDDAATATASSSKEGSPQSENASSPVGGGGCGGGGGGGHSDLASSPSSQTVCSSAVAGSSSPSSSSPPPPHGQKTGSALTSAESKGSGSTRSSGSENGASATGTGVKKTSAAGVVDIPSPSS